MQNLVSWVAILISIIYAIFGISMGYAGIEYHLGTVWAIVAMVCALVFRISLPIAIGAFFGMVDVLGWHWIVAILISVPSLLLLVPGLVIGLFEPLIVKFVRNKGRD